LNKLATKIATVRRAEDITVHDATILSHTANPALDGIFRKDTHRDPSGDKPQHELAGVTIIIR
jgi:hypothetical protein